MLATNWWWILPMLLNRLIILQAQNNESHSPFLNDVLGEAEEGYKETGESCNGNLIRPCKKIKDVCRGQPPTCHKPKDESRKVPLPEFHSEFDLYDDEIKLEEKDLEEEKMERNHHNTIHQDDPNAPKNDRKTKVRNSPRHDGFQSGRSAVARDVDDEYEITGDTDLNAVRPDPPIAPPFNGNLSWTGKIGEPERPCIFNSQINDVYLDHKRDAADKKAWAKENEGQICDFHKFQVCTSNFDEFATVEKGSDHEHSDYYGEEGTGAKEQGYCRCLETTNVLVDGVCYIPANNGSRSICGKTKPIYQPVPPWTGLGPNVELKCVPNAICNFSPYWFGLRCTCPKGFAWVRSNSTCRDDTIKDTFDLDGTFVWNLRFGNSSNDTDQDSHAITLPVSNSGLILITFFYCLLSAV